MGGGLLKFNLYVSKKLFEPVKFIFKKRKCFERIKLFFLMLYHLLIIILKLNKIRLKFRVRMIKNLMVKIYLG